MHGATATTNRSQLNHLLEEIDFVEGGQKEKQIFNRLVGFGMFGFYIFLLLLLLFSSNGKYHSNVYVNFVYFRMIVSESVIHSPFGLAA